MFAAEGARVIATDIDDGLLASVAGCDTRRLDVTDHGAVDALAQDLGAVDILFNCAGMVHHGTILDCDAEDWDRSFTLNVTAMYGMIRAFLPAMLDAGGAIDRQHGVDRELGQRGAQPLRLRHHQGRRDRAHEVGCRRFHYPGASAATRSVRAP